MTPLELAWVYVGCALLGVAALGVFVLAVPLRDLFRRRKAGVPRRAVLEYYPDHLRGYFDWGSVARAVPMVAVIAGTVGMLVAVLGVGFIEVFA